jgi:hypothetical protein
MHRRLAVLAVLALVALVTAVPAATPAAGTDTSALRSAVTVNGVMAHEKAFQQIANRHGGPRRPAKESDPTPLPATRQWSAESANRD